MFGNVGDAALLMDVYRPSSANGVAIIFISGSGWGGMPGYNHDYDDVLLKDDALASAGYEGRIVQGLANRGYTVFAITHRFAPEVRSPQPIYDAQRAVRFVRANAAKYGIDPTRLGAIGHSSGAHLSAMLGAIDTTIDNPNIDFSTLAKSMGVYSQGPITNPADVGPAIQRAIAVVKKGEPALIDIVSQPR